MIQLLFKLILIEMALILSFVIETPLRELALTALDRLKQGRGLIMVRTYEGILLAAFVPTIYRIIKKTRCCSTAGDLVNPMDEVLVANKILQASLMGFLLCLSMVADKLHRLVREHSSLKQMIIAEEKQLEERQHQNAESLEALVKGIAPLKTIIKKLELEYERKEKHANTAKANEMALIKQSEELEQEYDRLLEYNQILRNQLQSIDKSLLIGSPRSGWSSLKSNILGERLFQFPPEITYSSKSRGEFGPEINLQTTNQSSQYICSGGHAVSSPRHRRPIYQQMSLTL